MSVDAGRTGQELQATPVSRHFQSQRLTLHYVEWGSADAEPLILIHGGCDHGRSWDWVARDLARDWRVIAPDLRGHGDSEWSSSGLYTYDAYVWDLLALLDHLQQAKILLIGHSLGGNIALRFAAMFPDRVSKLVCIEGLGSNPEDLQREADQHCVDSARELAMQRHALNGWTPATFPTLDVAIARMREKHAYLSADQAEHLARHGTRLGADGMLRWKFDVGVRRTAQKHQFEDEIRAYLERITCPVLTPWGGKSFMQIDANRQRVAAFPNVTMVEYSDAGHWLQHQELHLLLRDVRAFL